MESDKTDHVGRAWIVADKKQRLGRYFAWCQIKICRCFCSKGIAGKETDKNREKTISQAATCQMLEKGCQENKRVQCRKDLACDKGQAIFYAGAGDFRKTET